MFWLFTYLNQWMHFFLMLRDTNDWYFLGKIEVDKAINSEMQQIFVLKACVRYFLSIFCFSPNDSPSETVKNVFISSKKLFSFLRYSNFCIFLLPSFFPVSPSFFPCHWSKKNLKIYDVINCLNNSITHFVLDLEKEIR